MPDKQVHARPARLDDSSHVWPLVHEFATSFDAEREAFDVAWPQLVDVPDTLVLVAETAAGKVVGYLLANSHLAFHANGRIAWVEEITVDARRRHSGVGRLLMEHAERWARSVGAAYIALATRRAAPFYLALDYEESAVYFKKPLT
ncbi:GNAT family N-acetyltransferase [Kribbella sp. GL6]|uniref:GNAT family N-acetyltransferase n=1 Tax=Kribbella sp. GL6 TaxID=3419765 RepID=UPI003D030AB7